MSNREKSDATMEICLVDTEEGSCVSFVNGMITPDGGVHVNQVYSALSALVLESINQTPKKKDAIKSVKLTMADVKAHLSVVMSCRLENPKFGSQMKGALSSPHPKISLDSGDIAPLKSWSLLARLKATFDAKEFKLLQLSDGGKKKALKLLNGEDANWAKIPAKRDQCTLFLIEGKSAQNYAVEETSFQTLNGALRSWGISPHSRA